FVPDSLFNTQILEYFLSMLAAVGRAAGCVARRRTRNSRDGHGPKLFRTTLIKNLAVLHLWIPQKFRISGYFPADHPVLRQDVRPISGWLLPKDPIKRAINLIGQ